MMRYQFYLLSEVLERMEIFLDLLAGCNKRIGINHRTHLLSWNIWVVCCCCRQLAQNVQPVKRSLFCCERELIYLFPLSHIDSVGLFALCYVVKSVVYDVITAGGVSVSLIALSHSIFLLIFYLLMRLYYCSCCCCSCCSSTVQDFHRNQQ